MPHKSPDRRDHCVEPLFAAYFPERDRNHCLPTIDKENTLAQRKCLGVEIFVAGKGANEGATVFMNHSG